ncbi:MULTISPECIES: hypothetical protein [unclassified Sphingosinithalassobacter]|uniref:hypothetical protein n=1 Tax=unclassified Sphingosinithalassobacter TaxID=2676235 RepID=UPI00165D84E1|nr:hypothetical protein [Sphingosinithalassobacter sp. CS137]
MKKILTVAAAAGLMTLAACEPATVENDTAANMIEELEANAAMYENAADMASNEMMENVYENTADVLENQADMVEDNAMEAEDTM